MAAYAAGTGATNFTRATLFVTATAVIAVKLCVDTNFTTLGLALGTLGSTAKS